jgi:hypothetical protein
MIDILATVAGMFIVMLLVAPIILLTILLLRTSKPKLNQSSKRLDELAEIDAAIIEETNAALATVLDQIKDIEERLDREDSAIKGFGNKK